jgi:hypothetical protein
MFNTICKEKFQIKSPEKRHGRNSPVRVPVIVMRLADLKAKPDANHANPNPIMPGRVKFATSTAPLPPLADLVSNPTPPGQISRERASLVNGQLVREIGWQGL